MKLGVKNSVGVERIQISETNVDYPQKVLFGPVPIATCFIPAHVDGARKIIAIPVDPGKQDIIGRFVAFDTEIRRQAFLAEHGNNPDAQKQVTSIHSGIKPSYTYLYLGFDKRTDNLLGTQVRILEHKYSVKEAIRKIQMEPYKTAQGTNPTKMHFAPVILMTLIVLRHLKDPTKKETYTNIDYSVTPILPITGMQGYFDMAYAEADIDIDYERKTINLILPNRKPVAIPIEGKGYKNPIFTDEELAAIQTCDVDIEKYSTPFSDEQIKEKLMNYPIDINAVRDGKPYFPHKEMLIEKLKEFHFNYVELAEKATVAIPENVPDKKEDKKAAPKKTSEKKQQDEIEEAEFETIEFGESSDNDEDVPDTVSFTESDEKEVEEVEKNSDVELPDFMKKKK